MAVETEYDFIIVGSGPAGNSLVLTLSKSPQNFKILVFEAGGPNSDPALRVTGQRWITLLNKEMNYGYKTAPQIHCDNRELDYARGKGLGGSTAINFGFWTVGAAADYDEWARLVGDESFNWANMQRRFKALEGMDMTVPAGVDKKYVSPKPEDHGASGPVKVGFAPEWEEDILPLLDTFEKAGYTLNPDHNSGNPVGMSVVISSAHKGIRSTSNDLLTPVPGNVTILTDSPVQRVVMDGKKAVAVETNGKRYAARKEIILCAGTLDTPRILMHSGIGPADQLEKHGIPVVHPSPFVGAGLKDHSFCPLLYKRTPESGANRGAFYADKALSDAALEQWKKDGSGPWSKYACEFGVGFFKLGDELTSSKEFLALPPKEQKYLLHETVPHYELITHFPMHWFFPGFDKDDREAYEYSCLLVFMYNGQSQGIAKLQSSDPDVPLEFDPNFFGEPIDRRIAVESLRDALKFAKSPAYAKDTIGTLAGPKSESEADLLEYWRQALSSSWHMTGTTKMGREGDADAVVDPKFRVIGVEGLRVADMSVPPVLPNCHTQTVAYMTGMACGETILKEYA